MSHWEITWPLVGAIALIVGFAGWLLWFAFEDPPAHCPGCRCFEEDSCSDCS